ncbi:serine/threonine protein kinase [Mycolicibacterium rufum]|uniref:non-specific serine/threonine protein kinase n=1 Tax=Mycolicibacterium rufum TaxID=318424 RepID=A0A9X3BKU1_9MYCO|nr:serine/threonine-protein kinase [Mycolicibacterium rufum]KGI70274.1 serine/threonine protein kinase [Mycolicibacterium rufum]MCV7074229.1 serine/threonine protein kinase [Mycolicibacterium rufum]ULP36572.1 serine/threonine protein kinase [Mycolicibacterium rufum]
MPLSEGDVIAGYTIARLLGSGGMGEVYLAQHPRLPRYDALKVLSPTVCADSEYRERFSREADIAAGLWHPHIVAVHDRGEFDGRLWISMDNVEGTDAGKLLAERYPDGMPPDLVVRIVTAVGEALDYAHARGLLHRDVKPANILISDPETADERIMLADFGIARRVGEVSSLTGTDMTVGTVAYSAPEQLTADKSIDGRADQYALAATAYQLLTGSPPFQHTNPAIVISSHLSARPPSIAEARPDLSGLGGALEKALAKSPGDRFEHCVDFARALANRTGAAALPRTPDPEATMPAQAAAGPRHARPGGRAPRSRGRMLAVLALLLSLLAVAAALFVVLHDDPAHAPETVAVPVVVVGADCATLGAAGVTESGSQAYCARVSGSNQSLWSLYSADIAKPTGTGEVPVQVCVQQTNRSQEDCRGDIARENADPGANDG